MPKMQMDALFTIVGGTLTIVALTVLSACHAPLLNVETMVDVKCPPGQGSGQGDPGVGISCTGNSAIILPANTLVSTIANVVTIPANQTIPPGAVCRVDATHVSTKCKDGIPGQPCGYTPGKKCRDTYIMDISNPNDKMCECRCN